MLVVHRHYADRIQIGIIQHLVVVGESLVGPKLFT